MFTSYHSITAMKASQKESLTLKNLIVIWAKMTWAWFPFQTRQNPCLVYSCASPGSRLAGYFLFHSTTVAEAQAKDFSGRLQEALEHRIFDGSVGDQLRRWVLCLVHTGGASKCLCYETRRWNDPTVLRRFHLVCRGPKGFIQEIRDAWATHKAAPNFLERGNTLPCLPSKSELLVERTPRGVSWVSLADLSNPGWCLSQVVRLLVISSSLLGTDGWATAVRAQRGGYIS